MKNRPNSNYVLAVMRDGDMDDPWGTAMAWAFAVAESLTAIGAEVPAELQYSPSCYVDMSTWEPESYEDEVVFDYLQTSGDDGIRQVQFAGRCLHRYIEWCRAAGRDY